MNKLRPYLQLLKHNRNFRGLWLSQVISNFGDWFGILAVYTLILRYSDSEFLLGLILVIKFMSVAVFSPLAGYIADRFDRRTLLILCDFGRGFIVLGFLLVTSADLLWLVYILTAAQMMLSAVFEPAKQSSIPNITTGEELMLANVVSTMSWSIIFTTGMGIGGLATAYLGTDVVFILNAVSYIGSTWFIFKADIPHIRDKKLLDSLKNPLTGIMDGFRYLFSTGHILRPALAKGTISFILGGLVYMLILISEEVLVMGTVGLGLLYASRGLGTAIGPVLVRRFIKDDRQWITTMGVAMITTGTCYLIVGQTDNLWVMVIFVALAHCGSGANWVMSTVLLQKRSPDELRGRVFSSEWLFFTITQSISVLASSLLLDYNLLTLRELMFIFSFLLILTGAAWLLTISRKERFWQKEKQETMDAPVLKKQHRKILI
ncbi:MAG: MFS transporter [Balneolales bacterium]